MVISWLMVKANREISELGGDDVAVCPEGLISWVFTSVLRSVGSWSRGGDNSSLVTRVHFCRAVMIWGGSILENESLIFGLVCVEVAISLRVMRPTSSDARLGAG